MKNIYIILLVLFALASCEEFLEEDRTRILATDSTVMQSETGFELATAGMYKALTHSWTSGFSSNDYGALFMGADDVTTSDAANRAVFRDFDQLEVQDINSRLALGAWPGCYKAIQNANMIIANHYLAEGDRASLDQMAGEAYFIRAYCYFVLARFWRTVPILLESHNFSVDYLTMEPSSTAEVYDQILVDLDSAEANMADVRVEIGRAGKGSVILTRAKVYLQMSGWPLNLGTPYYTLAAAESDRLITNKDQYELDLLDDYADLWLEGEDGNSEEVFALSHEGLTSGNSNGLTIYGSAAWPGIAGIMGPNNWGDKCVELNFFNNYPDQYRKTESFLTEVPMANGDTVTWNDTIQLFHRPYFQKFTIPDKPHAERTWENDKQHPILRFAEAYLVYAEAQVMATGNPNDATALERLNIINRRAWGEDLYTPGAHEYTTATQEIIVQEKAWEFAGEFVRWHDITRLQMLPQIVAERHPSEHPIIGDPNDSYWMPFPNAEKLINPNLID